MVIQSPSWRQLSGNTHPGRTNMFLNPGYTLPQSSRRTFICFLGRWRKISDDMSVASKVQPAARFSNRWATEAVGEHGPLDFGKYFFSMTRYLWRSSANLTKIISAKGYQPNRTIGLAAYRPGIDRSFDEHDYRTPAKAGAIWFYLLSYFIKISPGGTPLNPSKPPPMILSAR